MAKSGQTTVHFIGAKIALRTAQASSLARSIPLLIRSFTHSLHAHCVPVCCTRDTGGQSHMSAQGCWRSCGTVDKR